MEEVGVLVTEQNSLASLMEAQRLDIYQLIDLSWVKIREEVQCFGKNQKVRGMQEMREMLKELIVCLNNCKILIGTIFTGLPYMILDQEGIMLCEAETLSEELLTTVEQDYRKMEEDKKAAALVKPLSYPTEPYKTQFAGIYELDLRKLQEAHPEISSKKALMPFLKETKFDQLFVYCSHVLPWLEVMLPSLGCNYHTKKLEKEGYKIMIRPSSVCLVEKED